MTGASAESVSCPPPDPNPRSPHYKAPANACDCHAHVIGPAAQYPFVADRSYTPPDALLTDYLHMLKVIGIQRSVLVQPSMHGTDNTVMMNAIVATANTEMRAVVVVPSDVTDAELSALHQGGARGVRLNMIYSGGGVGLGEARTLAGRIKSFGWHLQALVDVSTIGEANIFELAALPVPLVIDHMGHFDARKGIRDGGFQALLECARRGNTWVKLSGANRLSAHEFPFTDVLPLTEALLEVAPDRMVWGTDWPHTVSKTKIPNDGDLIDLLYAWVLDDRLMERILVDNPSALYGFPGGERLKDRRQ
jgi:predicted TIM-barrel fold metal-dependent hydrolase